MEYTHWYTIGTICRARCTYRGSKNGELSFKSGDVLIVLREMDQGDKHYDMMNSGGSKGIVYSSNLMDRIPVPLQPMPWFHGSITRFEAEKLLDRNKEGQFLLRTSQHTNGIFALAMVYGGLVKHYLVAMNFKKRRLTIDGKDYLDNLYELVEYYKAQCGNALEVKLAEPVIRHGQLEYYIDTNILEQKWGLSKREIVVNQVIGKGEFGEVHAGEYRGLQVAIKTLLKDKQNAQAIANFTREAAVMSHLCHPNIVQLIGVHYHGNTLHSIIMELMGKGSLSRYLMTRGRAVISQKELFSFARDVCNGMEYLSGRGFVHRDIAARNVLLNGNGQAKISDLGFARRAEIHVPHEGGKFPTKWTAPEALKNSKFTVMSDVWSYGILLWEIFSFGRVPYPSIPSNDVLEQLEDGYRMDPPEGCPYHVYSIMEQCWMLEPSQRSSFTKLRELLCVDSLGDSVPSSSQVGHQQPSARGIADLHSLATSATAISTYREAPKSHKVAIFLASILMLGPEGSGKTSFVRSLKGETFRIHEAASVTITLESILSIMKDHLDWAAGGEVLSFDDQLAQLIVDDILSSSPGQSALSMSSTCSHSTEDLASPDEVFEEIEFRRRSSSTPSKPTMSRPKIRKFLSSFKRSHKKTGKTEKRHSRSSSSLTPPRGGAPKVTILTNDNDGHRFLNDPSSPPSSIPETIVKKVVEGLECRLHSTAPPPMYARIIDCPGGRAHCLLRPLLVTTRTLSLLLFDASLDPYHVYANSELPSAQESPSCTTGHSIYLDHILNELADMCLHQPHHEPHHELQRGSRIILIGTHCDRVSMSVANHRLSIVAKAVDESPFRQYVVAAKFVVSSSSILERSNLDEIKRFLMEQTQRLCKQQIPVRWLCVVPKIKELEKQGQYFITLDQLRKIAPKSSTAEDDDFDQLLSFLTGSHIILHFDLVHLLRNVVITSPSWFLKNVSTLLSLTSPHNMQIHKNIPDELLDKLLSTGLLSEQLLNLVWGDVTDKAELLNVMHKMELICCLPASQRQQQGNNVSNVNGTDDTISQTYIPALVEEEAPSYLHLELSTTDIKPLYFRFKSSHVPLGLYYRLIARCIFTYPHGMRLYHTSASFVVDKNCTLVLSVKDNLISLMLQDMTRKNSVSSASSPTAVTESQSTSITNDVCLAVLMFLQAAITDIIHQWIPQLDFDLCVPCHCMASNTSAKTHYVILNDSEEWMEAGILICELGSQFLPLSGITRWFGTASESGTELDDDIELATVDDIVTVAKTLGQSWKELGHLLGFSDEELRRFSFRRSIISLPALITSQEGRSQPGDHMPSPQSPGERMLREWLSIRGINARLFSLLSALEIIQRRDVADSLIAARMVGPGVMI